jgi:hypothetical protein
LGLPCDLLVRGFQLNIFLTVLESGILCTWPNQLSLSPRYEGKKPEVVTVVIELLMMGGK